MVTLDISKFFLIIAITAIYSIGIAVADLKWGVYSNG